MQVRSAEREEARTGIEIYTPSLLTMEQTLQVMRVLSMHRPTLIEFGEHSFAMTNSIELPVI